MLPDVLTPDQVADYLQLDTETVYRLIRDHRLAATLIGRAYRIPRADLDAFMDENSTRAAVRQAAWERVWAYAQRENPDGDSEEILEWLEGLDDARRGRGERP